MDVSMGDRPKEVEPKTNHSFRQQAKEYSNIRLLDGSVDLVTSFEYSVWELTEEQSEYSAISGQPHSAL